MIDYATIKSLAKQHGLRVADLCALAPKNDPFYTGRPSEQVRANWFAELWGQFGYVNGVHLRRMHYRIVSQDPPVERPDGQVYQNTQRDWDYLNESSKWARYLGLVSPGAFVDRRNPEAIIHANWITPGHVFYEDPAPCYSVENTFDEDDLLLPELPELDDLPYDLVALPDFEIEGYESIQQPYHIELWVEKTTMNDVLDPLCKQYGANLITGAGEMSITSVVEFIQRVRGAQRPARILYISDFDPAGLGMPISVARKIEYFQRNEDFGDLDIRLHPVALTSEQIGDYDLPRVPVKNTDKRKASFEAHHGEGQVELDALEALHPGELARIVTGAILDYYDPSLPERARGEQRALIDELNGQRNEALDQYSDEITSLEDDYQTLLDDFEATQGEFAALVENFQPKIDAHQDELAALTKRAETLHNEFADELAAVQIDVADYPLPEPDLDEISGLLYESQRDYVAQLQAYKSQRLGLNGKEA